MQKLMGLVQYAPEEEQNELATLLAKAASTKTVQRKVTDGNKLAERGLTTRENFLFTITTLSDTVFITGYTMHASVVTDTISKLRRKTLM